MTELRLEPYEIPAADLGPENPLPVFRDPQQDAPFEVDPSVPEEDRRYLGWRTGYRVLPHRMLDGYTRERGPRSLRAAVLENETLRATVLLGLGGRVASLVHKPSGRDLVDRNPIFQPANLGLRNAWFCGGIEWNTSQFGHYYLTCSPVFAARVTATGGEPVLRLYEWDRVKCFPWQIDLSLPPGSPVLLARVRLVNPHGFELPMYWWTNMGVPESPDIRTLVPADSAIHNGRPGFALTSIPALDGQDVTYPTNSRYAKEFFFRIGDGSRHWIASLDASGRGIVHTSTARLRGRKMFVFGTSQGGRRWQEYLMGPGRAYYEIQAGLARTQAECVPMPAGAVWAWTEAFGLLEADPADVHSADWAKARRAAEAALDALMPQSRLEEINAQLDEVSVRAADELLARGSGWGALERRRLALEGKPDMVPPELVFDDRSMGDDQAPWLALLEGGEMPERDPADGCAQFMVQDEWRSLLESALAAGRGDHWLSWLHLGVMRMEAGDTRGAREAWLKSVRRTRTGWALRNLAVLQGRDGDLEAARELLREAWEAGPKTAALAVDYAQSLAAGGEYQALREFVAGLPSQIAASDRMRLMAATAALRTGHLGEVEQVFEHDLVTVREGETSLTNLWFELHERRIAAAENLPMDDELRRRVRREFPPPASIDFRMGREAG